ncbi:rho GTPase-activating protein 24-like [Nerophis lumbriciformis]|uniref:rho GTPase-activating protein 24-like n=1 Tax=Nerophis lumbriciformis TaxID=546530 RepID=UPI002AE0B00F|nr:rho GTPase-activating protein 24-like [Nerophis lumbriciformis]
MQASFKVHTWATKLIQEAADEGRLEDGCNDHQELDCGFVQEDQMLHYRRSPAPQSQVQHQAQTHWAPKVPPPLPLADPSASALRSLLTNLQQHIVKQQQVYEGRIVSLEERNKELQDEVVCLKSNLSRQRDWYQVLQAKITESERERAAAERCNSALQKDMERFFDTFGELNNEAKKTENIIGSF